jgi:hypothetical protein
MVDPDGMQEDPAEIISGPPLPPPPSPPPPAETNDDFYQRLEGEPPPRNDEFYGEVEAETQPLTPEQQAAEDLWRKFAEATEGFGGLEPVPESEGLGSDADAALDRFRGLGDRLGGFAVGLGVGALPLGWLFQPKLETLGGRDFQKGRLRHGVRRCGRDGALRALDHRRRGDHS